MGFGHIKLLSDFFLAAHRIKADCVTFEIKLINELGNGRDFIGFRVNGKLTEGELIFTCPSTDEMQARRGVSILKATTSCFSINSDELMFETSAEALDEDCETGAKLVRIDVGENTMKGVVT